MYLIVERNNKTTDAPSARVVARIALALFLAFALAFVPLSGGLSEAAWATDDVPAPATAPDPATSVTPPVDPETPSVDIKDIVNAADVEWAEAFMHYMDNDYTEEELLSIDADFFDDKDAELAKRIRDDQQVVKDKNESGSGEATPGEDSDSGSSSSDSSSSSSTQSPDNQQSTGVEAPADLSGAHEDPSTDQFFSKPDGLEADTGPFTFSPNPTTDEFIASIGEQAREIGQESDLYASVMIAQAILESGSGSSLLSKEPHFNLFGIKGSYHGSSVNMQTAEDDGTGSYYDIVSSFRSYPTTRESLADYAELLTVTMRSFYEPVLKSHTESFNDACDYLQGHYATSTTYSAKLKAIIEAYDLTTYDDKAEVVEETPAVPEVIPAAAVQMPVEIPVAEPQLEPQPEPQPIPNVKQLAMVGILALIMAGAYAMDVFRKKKGQSQSDA